MSKKRIFKTTPYYWSISSVTMSIYTANVLWSVNAVKTKFEIHTSKSFIHFFKIFTLFFFLDRKNEMNKDMLNVKKLIFLRNMCTKKNNLRDYIVKGMFWNCFYFKCNSFISKVVLELHTNIFNNINFFKYRFSILLSKF